ncbi:hypothetical protein ACHAWF_012411 [Thalassiosira exigua]
MLARTFSTASRLARRPGGDGAARILSPPSLVVAPSSPVPSPSALARRARRPISSSTPLRSSTGGEGEGEAAGEGEKAADDGDEKKAMIKKWMNWNKDRVWRYEPNHELIAQIGKEGTSSPLDQFRDLVPREKREAEQVGRSWSVKELRRKSYEDLHKLWYVLYKEKNMLLTETNLARRNEYTMVQPERRQKVRKSMGAIKHVLGERKRKKIADHKAYLKELERFDGIMAKMNLESSEGDEIEEAMDAEGK